MMEPCSGIKEDLSGYLDEQLDATRKAEIVDHLADCGPCRQELDDLRALSRFLGQGMRAESTELPDLWAKLSERLPSTCELISEDLSAVLDGELPLASQEGVSQHLKGCEPCRQKFRQLNATNQLLAKGLELPDRIKVDLWPAVKAKLNEDCALIQSELSVFVDQEVATLRHRAITSHLLDCPACRSTFSQLSQVGEIVRNFYQPKLAEDFDLWPEIKAKLQVVPFAAKAKPKPRPFSHRLYLVGAAAVVVGVVGSLTFFLSTPNSSGIRPVSAEAYLLESAMMEPADSAETVVYENQ